MADCDGAPSLTPFHTALEQLLYQVEPTKHSENVALDQACGRVLAQDVFSHVNIPAADNSAMDGYAIRSADVLTHNRLSQAGNVFAGHPLNQLIEAGQCVRIMTGGQIPDGCDAVVMQENTLCEGDQVTVLQAPVAGENIRRAGEDIDVGKKILFKGRRLTPADVGLLASLGIVDVCVFEMVTVALLSTGDELQKPGLALAPGQFYESNSYTVGALLKRFGVKVINFGIVPDDIQLLRNTFIQANEQADVVITSGGVSVGEADYTKTIIEELGRIEFWKLAMKPGKPFAFGHLPSSYVMGLPGNPVSALVTLHQLVIPMLRKVSGQDSQAPLRLKATTLQVLRKRAGRMDFQRGYFTFSSSGDIEVQTTGAQGSGILSSMSAANCYIVLPQDSGDIALGATVLIEPFDELLR